MAEAGTPATPVVESTSSEWRWDLGCIALMVLLVVPLRVWLVYNTEVAARDSIGYIRYALQFESMSWKKVLDSNHQHPGYPLSIWAVSVPMRALTGPADPVNMRLAAQIASSIAAVLLIIPMYFLGKMFFGRRIGFGGTLLFQYLPVSGHHLSDGVSEALFLLLTSSAFLFILLGMRRHSLVCFGLGGVFCGLSYLTRPESIMILVATLAVFGARQLLPACRQRWKPLLAGTGALLLSSVVVGSIYFGTTHTFSNKPTFVNFMKKIAGLFGGSNRTQAAGQPAAVESSPVLLASIFAATSHKGGPLSERLGTGFYILGFELLMVFQYLGLLAVGLGMLWHLPRLLWQAEFQVPMLFVALHGVVILALACSEGYISDRHLMVIAVWWSFFAVAGFVELPGKLISVWPAARQRIASVRWAPAALALVLAAGFIGMCLPRTLQRVHGNRVGNRLAGLWLAEHIEKGDIILDDHNWSHYYAGMVFKEQENPPVAPHATPKCYVVMTRSQDRDVAKQRLAEEEKLQKNGAMVYHWPENSSEERARVVIYETPRDRRTHPWRLESH